MKLCVGTPAYGGQVTLQYYGSMIQLVWQCAQEGLPLEVKPVGSESLITRARNVIVHSFLKTDATHLLFVDADIGFQPSDVFRMLQADKAVLCGAYPKKSIDWKRVGDAARAGKDNLMRAGSDLAINFVGETMQMQNGCIEVLDAATGFMLIKREVLERMILAYPETLYQCDHPNMPGEPMYALFDCIIDGGRYLSEDYTFCRRWQRIGGKIHMFVDCKLTHTGPMTYEGHLMDVLEVA